MIWVDLLVSMKRTAASLTSPQVSLRHFETFERQLKPVPTTAKRNEETFHRRFRAKRSRATGCNWIPSILARKQGSISFLAAVLLGTNDQKTVEHVLRDSVG